MANKAYVLILSFMIFMSCTRRQKEIPVKKHVHENKASEVFDWGQFENDVFQTIDSIEKSNQENRKRLILKLLSFREKLDGSVAEGYGNFAFEYIEDNPEKFFSVLSENDTIIISDWAAESAAEVVLVGENSKGIDSVWKEINRNHSLKRTGLDSLETVLDEYYLGKLKIEVDKYQNGK